MRDLQSIGLFSSEARAFAHTTAVCSSENSYQDSTIRKIGNMDVAQGWKNSAEALRAESQIHVCDQRWEQAESRFSMWEVKIRFRRFLVVSNASVLGSVKLLFSIKTRAGSHYEPAELSSRATLSDEFWQQRGLICSKSMPKVPTESHYFSFDTQSSDWSRWTM